MAVGTRTVTQQTSLECTICGSVNTIWRKRSKMKKKSHTKHMYCVKCMTDTAHTELRLENELPAWLREEV